ncbi:hypothetical protein BDB00DRAFT_879139 [Zychaea mexicana]|uniref:uncharacterized protein n=1 Tax=Zychaea mexicana TaxID=64656 RepID=UPI0022FE68F2|nr:uncharacterized protein BDB00DRAFT_879139 [Zychaea mexicana]KAI9482500.1 hypothetical protein BDB00DRAFT_879139 [Zychaea mexicana]
MHDKDLWFDIEKEVTQLSRVENSYRLQAMQILEKLSHQVTKGVLQSIDQNITSGSRHHSNKVSETNTTSSEETTEHATIKVPSIQDRYRLGETDVSIHFYAFQLVSKNNYKELLMETHVQQILALSSIFLVQKDKYNDDLKAIIGKKTLDAIDDKLQKQYNTGRYSGDAFDPELAEKIRQVVKCVKNKKATRLDGVIDLLTLSKNKNNIEKKLIKPIANLLDKLPKKALKSEIKEVELCHRYIDPILSALFDDPKCNTLTSTTNQECKDSLAKGSITSQRPDSCVSELNGLYFGSSLGYVEIIRLLFFINELRADGMYFLTEIAKVKASSCIEDLSAFIHYFDDIAAVLKCYEKNCVPLPSDQISAMYLKRRPTIQDEEFDALSPSKSNK